jgi:flagellar basal-body rod protein FlgG
MAYLALQSSATGLSALNTKLDVIANNLANVNTNGFKAARVNFQDLLYVERAQPGVENALGDKRPTGLNVGLGVKVSGTQNDFSPGAPITTNHDLDLMIDGQGFFKVTVENSLGGGIAYTRSGNFTMNADGEIVLTNDQGRRLDPNITIPNQAIPPIRVTSDGHVQVTLPGSTQASDVGQIQLVTFVNPAGLKQVGENLFVETEASGSPQEGEPAADNRGKIVQNQLEGSNVDPTSELIEMIRTQRAFEMNSNTIRAADETLRAVAQLRQ